MDVTEEQFIIRTVGAVLTLTALTVGGKMVIDSIDFNHCVGKETNIRKRMYGTPNLPGYVKGEIERVCRSGKER